MTLSIRSKTPLFLLPLILFSIFGCAPLGTHPKSPSISQTKIQLLREGLAVQNRAVQTFVSTGSLEMWDTSQHIPTMFLTVASRNPFRLKVEITHSWGLPLLHILLNGNRVTVVDLYHHRTYHSALGIDAPFLDKMPLLDRALMWSIMRAFPEVKDRGKISWSNKDRALVVKEAGEVTQEIRFDRNLQYPVNVVYPNLEVDVKFSDFTAQGNIVYAKKVKVTHLVRQASMRIKIKKIFFNQALDPKIFDL